MEQLHELQSNTELVIKQFFKMLITKEFIHKSYFEKYYGEFLSSNKNKFSKTKYNKVVDTIYWVISEYDATTIRPNNIDLLDETIQNIITHSSEYRNIPDNFARELLALIEWDTIELDEDNELSQKSIDIVKDGLNKALNEIYFDTKKSEITAQVIQEVIQILKTKKD